MIDVSFGFGELALSHELGMSLVVLDEGEEVIDVADLAEMRAYWVQEAQLQENVSLNQVHSWFVAVAIDQVDVFHARKVMESVLDDIPVDHLFKSILNFLDLFLHFVLKDFVEKCYTLNIANAFPVGILALLSSCQEHFQC